MPINDPRAIAFTNQEIRPLAETLWQLKERLDRVMAAWNEAHAGNTLGAVFTSNLGESVVDNRETEGVSRLTGNDVALLITQADTIKTQFAQGGVAGIIHKPCVRF